MSPFLLALDQGTSSSRALLFDHKAQLLAQCSVPFKLAYPQPGWVEVAAETLWLTQLEAISGVLAQAGVEARQVAAIGLSNQRETLIAWDAHSGRAVAPAIIWQCRRTTADCAQLRADGLEAQIRARTGLVIDPYFSASKMAWLLREQPELRNLAAAGQLRFGTVDSWLVWQLSGGKSHVTDASNASRTQLYSLDEGGWDPWLLDCFGVPARCLPQIVASSGTLAHTDPGVLGARIAITGIAGDQQAALFGQACFEPGMVKNTYGTGCFLLMNTGRKALRSTHGLLSTVAWRLGAETTYALEGSTFVAGALIQWLRDELGLLQNAAESETLALSVPDNGGVSIVPAFSGLGAPYWDPQARGLICGLSRGSTRAHIVRAALEAVALQNLDLIECMQADTGLTLGDLRIDGGMSANNFLCQFQADVLGTRVSRPQQAESSAFGAVLLAGLGCGLWSSLAELSGMWRMQRQFEPATSAAQRAVLREQWHRVVARAR